MTVRPSRGQEVTVVFFLTILTKVYHYQNYHNVTSQTTYNKSLLMGASSQNSFWAFFLHMKQFKVSYDFYLWKSYLVPHSINKNSADFTKKEPPLKFFLESSLLPSKFLKTCCCKIYTFLSLLFLQIFCQTFIPWVHFVQVVTVTRDLSQVKKFA